MQIPGCDRAVVDIHKLRDYVLNPEHPRGQHKARVFAAALGITASEAEELSNEILNNVCSDKAVATELDKYGQRYYVDFFMMYETKPVTVRSTWIIRIGENFPRLTSCYVVNE